MDKKFIPSQVEEKIYRNWEESGLMQANPKSGKKPFSIILPPPNANADLHLGHAMYVYEDIMIRYHKLIGDEVLWLPGADHAGFETQYVFEKNLAKQGKSRFDYDRETLHKLIWEFVQENRPRMEEQLRRLGFFLDWTRNKFTLDQDIVKIVYRTFKTLYDKKLVYRAQRLVNYCTKDGTSFSDLEVMYVERKDPLYYMKYGPFTIATTRPETKFRDTALAVNPKDKRYKNSIGKKFEIQGLLGPVKMTVIPDPHVDSLFGTGIMKVTPAHDPHDFELGQKFNLPVRPIIDFAGRMDFSWFLRQKDTDLKYRARAEKYHGKKVAQARSLMVEDLKEDGLLLKTDDNYVHRIGTCYKCSTVIEPLPLEQWYIKIRPLADKSVKLLKKGKIKIMPPRFKKTLIQWLEIFFDWNISRQLVWGIRIPAWKCMQCKKWTVTEGTIPKQCSYCKGPNLKQDEDTFDTWFSSGQWPFATLMTTRKGDFEYFYPTSVMETAYDILPWWVARMIMLGNQISKEVPFKNVFFHGLVRDKKGQKMSKSKGNVINPLDMVNKYGADALRGALVFGVKEGSDQSLAEEKIVGMRNFTNKVWNIGRFLYLNLPSRHSGDLDVASGDSRIVVKNNDSGQAGMKIAKLQKEFAEEKKKYLKLMNYYKFSQAIGLVYEFLWHRFADYYIEELKEELKAGKIRVLDELQYVYFENLKMLHPFMPFVTEAVWQTFKGMKSSILNTVI